MATPSSAPGRFFFGPFEYDGQSGDFRKHGSRVRLQGQPMRVLSLLLERHNQVVSREELQQHLWSGTTFVDFEQGLNAAVNKLRQTLSDSADQPRYIETLPGRGYRFIAPLRSGAPKTILEFAPSYETPIASAAPTVSRRWMLLVVAIVGAVAGAYWLGTRRAEVVAQPNVARFTVSPPPGYALEGGASRQTFALSPDGTKLAYTAMDVSGAFSVFVRDFSSLGSVQLADSSGAHTLFWAPDGQSLFLTVGGKLRRSPLTGEGYLELGEAPAFSLSGAWIDPQQLWLSALETTYRLSPSGGVPEALDHQFTWPQALPDGRHILFSRPDPHTGRHGIYAALSKDPENVKLLLEADSRALYAASSVTPGAGYLLYIRAGALVAVPFDLAGLRLTGEPLLIADKVYSFFRTGASDFSVSDKGVIAYQSYVERSQMTWVDRAGRRLAGIGPANVNVKSARISPDGKRLAMAIYDVKRGAQTLWVFDSITGAGRQLTLDTGVRDGPVWSPDSKRLAYLLALGDRPRIGYRNADGSGEEEGLPSDAFQSPTSWSPDGRFVAYVNTGIPRFANETQGDVRLVDLARDRATVPLLSTPFHEANPVFSPDGKWLAFTSNESGRAELYVQGFRGGDAPGVSGERYLASQGGALAVRWRRDGREIYYLAFDGRVFAVPVSLSPKPAFGKAEALFSISTEARAAIHSFAGFDVSSDGQRFVIPVIESGERPAIVVIQNWEALLHTSPGT